VKKFVIDIVIVGCVVSLGVAHELRNLCSDLLMLEADEIMGYTFRLATAGLLTLAFSIQPSRLRLGFSLSTLRGEI